jgi:hypothetical protein
MKVLDAIAAAEIAGDAKRNAAVPFSSTLSTDDECSSSAGNDDDDDDDDESLTAGSLSAAAQLRTASYDGTSFVHSNSPLPSLNQTVSARNSYSHGSKDKDDGSGIAEEDAVVSGSSRSGSYRTISSPSITTPLREAVLGRGVISADDNVSASAANSPFVVGGTGPFKGFSSSSHSLRGGGGGSGAGGLSRNYSNQSLTTALGAMRRDMLSDRAALRSQFLMEVESCLLTHLTAPVPVSLQQLADEFKLTPEEAAVAAMVQRGMIDRQKAAGGSTNSGSKSQHREGRGASRAAAASAVTTSGLGSPILQMSTLKKANLHNQLKLSQQSIAAVGSKNPSHQTAHAKEDESDPDNRFANYRDPFGVPIPTVHNISIQSYIESFNVDLKSLHTTKVSFLQLF